MKLSHAAVIATALSSFACGEGADANARSSAPSSSASALAPVASAAPSSSSPTAGLPPPPTIPADDGPPPPPAPAPPSAPPMTDAQFEAFFATPGNKITAELFETALLGLAGCTVEPGWVKGCPAYERVMKVVQRYRGGDGFPDEPALRHLRHPSPAVRATAASFASQYAFGAEPTPDREARYLEALRSETEPEVLASLVRNAGRGIARNPTVRHHVLRALTHAEPRVRLGAIAALGRAETAAAVPDVLLHLAPSTRGDRPLDERVEACSALGKVEDARVVPLLERLLADTSAEVQLQAVCFEALVCTWVRYPAPVKPSREGYELTLRMLRAKPRPLAVAHFRGLEAIRHAGRASTAWSVAAGGFYDASAVSEALAAIALDDIAWDVTRNAAGRSLVALEQGSIIDATLAALKKQGTSSATKVATEMEKERSGANDPFGGRR